MGLDTVWDSVGWLSALQVKVQQPTPIHIECRNGAVNETVQPIGWMLTALYKKIMVMTATDHWGQSTRETQIRPTGSQGLWSI